MSDLIKIAVDAMGGDGSPKKIIDGIILNHSKNKSNFKKQTDIPLTGQSIEKKVNPSKKVGDFY